MGRTCRALSWIFGQISGTPLTRMLAGTRLPSQLLGVVLDARLRGAMARRKAEKNTLRHSDTQRRQCQSLLMNFSQEIHSFYMGYGNADVVIRDSPYVGKRAFR